MKRTPAKRGRAGRAVTTLLRLTLATLALVGPLAAVTMPDPEGGLLPKRGAGLVLFVSLQRQSMS